MKSKMRADSNGRARRLAVLNLALLVAAAPFYQASARDSSSQASRNELDVSPLDSRQEIGPVELKDVWIDAFNMSVCGEAEFRAWQKEESAFGCTGHAREFEQQDASERGNIAPRIVGEEFAQEEEFPSFVHMNSTGFQFNAEGTVVNIPEGFLCGATLIDRNLAVTAAHCVYVLSKRKLTFGSNFLDGTGGEVRQADRWCYPSKYKFLDRPYDLAIIRFSDNINYTSKISPACLKLDSRPSEDTTCAFAGLGNTIFQERSHSSKLKTLRVKRSCQAEHDDQSCYKTIDKGLRVTQSGDSGSPVICYDRCGPEPGDQVKAFAVAANSWGNNTEPKDIVNHVTDFHQSRSIFLELLQAIRREGNETTDSVECIAPS